MSLVRLVLRRHRVTMAAWLVLLVALCGGTISAYQSTYPTSEQRRTATELAQHDAATTLLYGILTSPGTPAAMFLWEVGAIATILASVMAVLVAVSVTRACEDDGTLELVRSAGTNPRLPLGSAFVVLVLLAVALSVGCAVAVGLQVGRVDGVTVSGAVAFGCVEGLTFLVVGALTVVLAQVAPTAGHTRMLGFAAVGTAFTLRAVGDSQNVPVLNWLTPLGLRATVQPFREDRWLALAAYVVVAAALGWLAVSLSDRREYGAGLLRRRDTSDARLHRASGLGLTAHLARSSFLPWAVAVACTGSLFSALGSGAVQQASHDDLGGFLGSQLGSDPTAGYFAYTGTVVGILASAFAVLSILSTRQRETSGLTDYVLTAGVRHWAPLAWQLAVTTVGTLTILVGTGALSAVVAGEFVSGADVPARAFTYVIGQWPAAMAAAGWTALLIGLRPRWTWMAWLPLILSGTLALLGPLLGISQSLQDLGLFRHVPDIASSSPDFRGLLILLVVAGTSCLLGVVGMARRDISTS